MIALIPEFIGKPTVLGIGEIGLNKNSRNELKILEKHIQVAVDYDQLILVHTPHLEDKLKGTRLILDALKNFSKVRPGEGDHRPRRGAHRAARARRGLLGRDHALPGIQDAPRTARSIFSRCMAMSRSG